MPPLTLLYHAFGRRPGADPHSLFVPVQDFERHLRLLTRYLRPLDLDGYLDGLRSGRWPRRSFLLTMDDGYTSVLEHATPLLSRFGVPAVLFVCPGLLGGTSAWMPEMPGERLLGADELRELPGLGVELGAHGMDHRRLPGLPPEDLAAQVTGARRALAEIVGREPRAFAYPEGLFDAAAVRAVREAGYEVAFSVDRGGGPFALTRRPVTARDSLAVFVAKLLPGYDRLWRASAGRRGLRRLAARVLGQRPRD